MYVYTDGFESREMKKKKKIEEKQRLNTARNEEKIPHYTAAADREGDPYKTIFIGRLPYEITEPILRRLFEQFGAVRRARLVYDLHRRPRGYGFVEYERSHDMHIAYQNGDGMRVMGRRVLVDVERGRTVKGWLPKRLGGGLGNARPNLPPKRKWSLFYSLTLFKIFHFISFKY